MAGTDRESPPPDEAQTSLDDEALQRLMREALQNEGEALQVDVLRGVQQRLRERSQGKFYGDRWSTVRRPPFATYFVTSLMMLAVILIIYAVLTPIVGDPTELKESSSPVQVIPPAASER